MMTPTDCVQYIKDRLNSSKSDDHARAKAQFRNYTPEQMNSPYGGSDVTPYILLAGYALEEAKHVMAIAFLSAVERKLQTGEIK